MARILPCRLRSSRHSIVSAIGVASGGTAGQWVW